MRGSQVRVLTGPPFYDSTDSDSDSTDSTHAMVGSPTSTLYEQAVNKRFRKFLRAHSLTISSPSFKFIFFTFFSGTSFADPWDDINNPANFDSAYQYHFSTLPMNGVLTGNHIPWSETYWPRDHGSINIRWNAPGTPGFDLYSPSESEARNMSRDQLAQLSPAEKFDLAMGRYDYPLTNEVAEGPADSSRPDWEGICDGWTVSAIQFAEPKPVDFKNPDGIVVPFGSSDVKGLMSYYAIKDFNYQQVDAGDYCHGSCDGMNAGAYHVILANEIGLKKKAFAADISQDHEIWNQPVFGFEFSVVGSGVSKTAFQAYHIHSKMTYTDELDQSSWAPVVGTPQFKSAFLENDYILEMDENGNITGGYWLSGKRPSVFWKPTVQVTFTGDWAGLNAIYHAKVRSFAALRH